MTRLLATLLGVALFLGGCWLAWVVFVALWTTPMDPALAHRLDCYNFKSPDACLVPVP